MPDMIVRLYDLPDHIATIEQLGAQGVTVRRALEQERLSLVNWVGERFEGWVKEVEVSFGQDPVSCFVALQGEELLGFAAYDVACINFFGPTGVAIEHRSRGIGRGLTLATLHAQKEQGYAYAIIGGVGPVEFYEKVVGAQLLEHSTPGIYG
ncbi:MAG: putative N-acetyltransferase YhbS [Halioglobus sp.]|jgi:predicted N-acetyltransferase YhbS